MVAKHEGRIFKVMGDGVLAEFASAVNAVDSALELQQGMAAANGDLPEDRRIVLRIGVNLGDIMVEGSDPMAMASTSRPVLKLSPSPEAS